MGPLVHKRLAPVRVGALRVHVDPFRYEISAEADEELVFRAHKFIEDCFVNLCWPLSTVWVFARYGYEEMQIQSLAPPTPPKEDAIDLRHHDPENPKHAINAKVFFTFGVVVGCLKFLLLLSFFMGGYQRMQADDPRSWAPVYAFGLAMFVNFTITLTLANKKALRKTASVGRLLAHRERRNEELLFGWLPFPWWVAVFELRIAAHQVGLDLRRRFVFAAPAESLREALGPRVCALLDRLDGEPVPSRRLEHVRKFFDRRYV